MGTTFSIRNLACALAALAFFALPPHLAGQSDMPTPRFGMCAVRMDSLVYVIGGASGEPTEIEGTNVVDALNLSTLTWDRSVPDMHANRAYAAAVAANGKIYVFGGLEEADHVLRSVEVYDTSLHTWSFAAPMLHARYGAAAVLLGDDIYLFGGADTARHILAQVERYSISANTWTEEPRMAVARVWHYAFVFRNHIFIAGGLNDRIGPLGSIEAYDTSSGSTIVKYSMQMARVRFGAVVRDSLLILISGGGAFSVLNNIEVVDMSSGTRVATNAIGYSRQDFVAVQGENNTIYLIGGLSPSYKNGFAPVPRVDEISVATGVRAFDAPVPTTSALRQNYPNPFNPSTVIEFSVPADPGMTSLTVFNLLGQKVADVVNERLPEGTYRATFDGSGLPSGVYLYRLTTGTHTITRRMMLVK